MGANKTVRIGLMGFGRTGRQLYELAAQSRDLEIVAIADIGDPAILHYLLRSECAQPEHYLLQGNFLVNPRFSARMLRIDRPQEVPWDLFDLDVVIDATNKFRDAASMQAHLMNGAPRVMIRSLPVDSIDRIVIPGINEHQIQPGDRLLSAGSATATALYLLLNILSETYPVEVVSMTSIHAYTSDQALQDYAGSDFRRSRSAAENIIPNTHDAQLWIGRVLPALAGKVMTNVLNVPIHNGCMLDTTLVLRDSEVGAEEVNATVASAVPKLTGILDVTEDPIVSSDVIGSTLSLLFDAQATVKAGKSIIKTLGWYENLGHAARMLDVVRLYAHADGMKESA